MRTDEFDVLVIGTGSAAQAAAARLREAGRTVAVIDDRPFGGTCALRGCDPKKVLVGAAEAIDRAGRMRGRGAAGDLRIDWKELISFKRSFTDPVPRSTENSFASNNVETYAGAARFTGPQSVSVDGRTLKGGRILIASGARPVPLDFPGAEYAVSSDDFMELDRLPERIVMVGGGYIAAEFSHIAARAGAKTKVLQRGGRMLAHFDADLVSWLMEKFQEIGVDVRTGCAVVGIEKTGPEFRVHARGPEGDETFLADLVVHSAGRIPNIGDIDLAAAGVAEDRGKLRLNEYLQSVSNPAVYAAGDAAGKGPPLTPIASRDGEIAAANILNGNHRRPDYNAVPSVAFTLPPIAAVGLSENEARKEACNLGINSDRVPGWYAARRVGQSLYGYKILVDDADDSILGAHLVGPGADEVINIFGLAIRSGLTATDLKDAIFAYPTGASDIGSML